MEKNFSLFVTCPRGLEDILAQELAQQSAADIRPTAGGVSCRGGWETVYRINLHSRCAGRVLLCVAQGTFHNDNGLYRIARQADWPRWFAPELTFKIQTEGLRARVKSLNFAALKVKDGLCDAFRDACGKRPSVEKLRPDIVIRVFIQENTLRIYLDTGGEALFKRGWRGSTGEAPLRENLAAGMLMLAGYDGTQPFSDPFCGSGTLAIEAALLATRRAPGRQRRFAFERFNGFDAALWQRLLREADAAVRSAPAPISGSDTDLALIQTAQRNAQAAQVADCIRWQCADALDTLPEDTGGIMVSNPPYGVRLSEIEALHALYPQMGSWLKQHFAGWRACFLTADRDMPKLMRLQPKRKIPLFNGNLDCRLFVLDMVAGSNRSRS